MKIRVKSMASNDMHDDDLESPFGPAVINDCNEILQDQLYSMEESPKVMANNFVNQPRVGRGKISTSRVLRQVTFGVQTHSSKKRPSIIQNRDENIEISPEKSSLSRLSSGLKKQNLNYKRRKSELKPKSSSVIDADRTMKSTQQKFGAKAGLGTTLTNVI